MAAADLLTEVETAISACLNSQSYSIRGRMQQRANLRELMEFRRQLISEVADASANSGSMASVGQIDNPT